MSKITVILTLLIAGVADASSPLRVNGSTTVNAVAAEAAEALRAQKAMEVTVDTQGGSSGGISGVGDGSIDVGMSSKGITAEDPALIEQTKANGVEVIQLTPEQKAVFQAATKDVYAKWKKTVGEALVDKAEAAVAKR